MYPATRSRRLYPGSIQRTAAVQVLLPVLLYTGANLLRLVRQPPGWSCTRLALLHASDRGLYNSYGLDLHRVLHTRTRANIAVTQNWSLKTTTAW
eukprot:COSAG01_NODE_1236_length_11101_cov_6.515179_5_plen_95_part_00